MKQKRLLFLLALLIVAVSGAWAKSTTHIVNQDNINTIFSGDGYTLGDDVKEGDVLDFQGTIDIDHSLVINKPVTVISSTMDAVIKLHTVAESLLGEAPGNSFVINKAGSGTTVQDIRIENTQTWLYNTSNVTFTGVTMWVEDVNVGAGVGHVAIRYSDHVTFDGCTVYAKNTGGTSGCVLTRSHDCTFKDTRFEAVGNAGNILNLGNPYNTNDMPAGYTMNADNISVLNCTLTKDVAASSMFAIGGLHHHIEGCTIVNMNVSSGWGATVPNSANEGHTILNNTITDGTLYVLKYCTAEGNTVTGTGNGNMTISQGATANNNTITVTGTGNVTINQGATANNNTITVTGTGNVIVNKGSTLTGNTINGNVTVSANSSDDTGSTITGNAINGTVTFASNSKNNTLTRNVITSTDDYAVVMASTADANNTVQYNTLIAATKKGDEAVNLSTGSGNTISNNSTIVLKLADGTKDAANWSATVNGEQPNPLPVGGLSKGDAVTLSYSGRLKVKSVTATKAPFAANEYIEASWDGEKVVLTRKTAASEPTAVESAQGFFTWSDGWYTVSGNVTITNNVSLGADTHLILQDGAQLTINGQLYCNSGSGYSLYIYGQEAGNGKLNVSNSYTAILGSEGIGKTIEIHGGEITATSTGSTGFYGYGIKMYGGKLTATSGDWTGLGFASSNFDVYGGEVEAITTGDMSACGIKSNTGTDILTVYGGTVKATGGTGSESKAIRAKIKSGTPGIKFYFADSESALDNAAGSTYSTATDAPTNRYAKAE